MSAKRHRKVLLSLTEEEETALLASARLRGLPKSTIARTIVVHALMGEGVPDAQPGDRIEKPDVDEAPWLQLGRTGAAARAWRQWAWRAGEALCARYPELGEGGGSALPDTWPLDSLFRDGLLALAVWRYQLDAGAYDDPRMELAFERALLDFCGWVRERRSYAGLAAYGPPERTPPAGWLGA